MVNKLILGTVQFGLKYGINNLGGKITDAIAFDILQMASSMGIKTLDTAADYGDSERKIGEFGKTHSQPFLVISKFSKRKDIDWLTSLEQSLCNLNLKKVDTIMFHSYEAYLSNQPIIEKIIKRKGEVFDKLGISVYTNEELQSLVKNRYIDVVQSPFNLLDNQNIRARFLIGLKNSGKIIHTRSVFLQGLFFMETERIPEKLKPLSPFLIKLREIVKQNNLSLGQLALQYALNKDYIDGVLIGVDSTEQLLQNISWAENHVDSKILKEIDEFYVENVTLLNPSLW